ncbi:TetR/AcrR family transcriptional regulator [Hyphomicrobium sp.]|uniref:TetR/AcrR family transcriptional regulator n=1 Tax=Hyphomicrobium sp. TaxID=82 RepID=UPI002E35B7D4|nr:TetR/AcrR family transcriptional regulator [Hyphomicrobium sp.]HEX2841641.1 TetR/AcrR family transcriptional regulator [Hyphomicrobium sp.]
MKMNTLAKGDVSVAQPETRRGGRPPAGTDPQKRQQILEGGGRVFSTLGFDAASMSDVAREARVSKATLYVYFQDKEHLFAAICAERRDRNIAELIAVLDTSAPLEQSLFAFGSQMLSRVSQPYVVAASRIVIGVAERMPEVGSEFFEAGAIRLANALAGFLEHHAARGELSLDDSFLAAAQFLELAQATVFRPRLYGVTKEPATEEEIRKVVGSAVRVFLAGYRRT